MELREDGEGRSCSTDEMVRLVFSESILNVNIYVSISEPNVVLRTLIKNQACARRRTGARRRCLPRARGWTALPAPSPAGQLLAPTREPASPAAPERSRAPARSPWAARAPRLGPPPHFLSRLHAPSRSLLRGRLRDPSLCGRFPSQTPRPRAPHGAHFPTSPAHRNLSGPPDVSPPPSTLGFRARRRGERAPVPRLHRGGAYHSDPMAEGEAEGAGAVPFAARGSSAPGKRGEEGGYAHTYRCGSGNAMGSTGLAQCREVPRGGPKGTRFVLVAQTAFNSTWLWSPS